MKIQISEKTKICVDSAFRSLVIGATAAENQPFSGAVVPQSRDMNSVNGGDTATKMEVLNDAVTAGIKANSYRVYVEKLGQ